MLSEWPPSLRRSKLELLVLTCSITVQSTAAAVTITTAAGALRCRVQRPHVRDGFNLAGLIQLLHVPGAATVLSCGGLPGRDNLHGTSQHECGEPPGHLDGRHPVNRQLDCHPACDCGQLRMDGDRNAQSLRPLHGRLGLWRQLRQFQHLAKRRSMRGDVKFRGLLRVARTLHWEMVTSSRERRQLARPPPCPVWCASRN